MVFIIFHNVKLKYYFNKSLYIILFWIAGPFLEGYIKICELLGLLKDLIVNIVKKFTREIFCFLNILICKQLKMHKNIIIQ